MFRCHMMNSMKDMLKSMMKEVNLHPNIQHELIRCAESGKTFPYVPKSTIGSKTEIYELPESSVVKLPSRPIQRPRSTIEKLGIYDRDMFRPTPSKTRPPHEKERLQNLMAFGRDIDEELRNRNLEETSSEEEVPRVDMFAEILREIKDRKEFLDDMAALGEEKKYLPEIQCQIALRLRELEKIDKERADLVMQKYRI